MSLTLGSADKMMDWTKLLSASRYQEPTKPDEAQRSVYQRDYDRIVFCAAFRRLQDKTQVHPFPSSDYVRRRLTHSLEVASVGRSLGFAVGTRIAEQHHDLKKVWPYLEHDVAQIVSNACLAHDIGNPPFGHAGEQAIGSWFKQNRSSPILSELGASELRDFEEFEGNAQGFRLLTRLQNSRDAGGLRLTHATLGAFTKYPTASLSVDPGTYIGAKKYGFFTEDQSAFAEIANDLGLLQRGDNGWCRHPLVFLVEAADDICYKIVDVEDALKLGRLSHEEAEKCFVGMLSDPSRYTPEADKDGNIGWLRAAAIGDLIAAAIDTYIANEDSILSGEFSLGLLDAAPNAAAIKEAKNLIKDRVFNWERTISAEISGVQMITEVLDRCMKAIEDPSSKINSLVVKTIPRYNEADSNLKKIHAVTDYVSGMTDRYLQSTYLRLTGHSIE